MRFSNTPYTFKGHTKGEMTMKAMKTLIVILCLLWPAIVLAQPSAIPPSDEAYNATTWDGVTSVAPSKNAVRDKIESLTTVAADTIFDAAGDIIQGTGANASARLAIGTAGQMLKVNSGATALEYTSTISIDTVSPTTLNLPSSNADPATTAGQIRHDSTDTDASAGGIIEWWDGTNTRRVVDIAASAAANYTVVTKTEYLPIRYAEDGTTGPAAAAEISTTTAIGRGFDKDADEDVVFWWVAPLDYVGGIKYRVIYALAADATADDTAVFSLAGCAAANSATLACTPGDAVTLADELTTDDDQFQVMISDYSTEVTVTNIAAGSLNRLVFLRDVSEDDYTEGDLLVIGIEIKYKARINGVDAY